MEKYHVYGIGNALVDMEYEVDTKFLQAMKVEKGVMTLVDENRQKELLEQLNGSHPTRACGGSAANTLIAVAQFGGKAFYSYKVGNDEVGSFYQENLAENGVSTEKGKGRFPGTTGKCLVLITPDADRSMNTFLGVTQSFGVDQLVEEELQKAEYLYIEGYLVATECGRESMKVAKAMADKHGVKVALSFSDSFIVKTFRKELLDIIGKGIHFIFCNEREALDLWEVDDLSLAADRMKKIGQCFAITQGVQGALVYDGEDFLKVAPYKVKAIDTNGAGDMFAGAFLYGITHGMTFADSGDLASKAAAQVVSQFGPRLTKEKGQEILQDLLEKKKKNPGVTKKLKRTGRGPREAILTAP